jgi:hypothetical protein
VVGADRLGHQLLGLGQHAVRHGPVVQAVHHDDVGLERVPAECGQHAWVDAAALLVSRR